ncbi:hypothetical protein VB779_07500 [Haloarculaceae archaeon H-GB11]|nr:hypothetical protein [Haloarculaceae archaeon H-GB11]
MEAPAGRDARNQEGVPGDTASSATGKRAQTTLDFAVGISIFLLLVGFVFVFAPGFLDPFTTGPVEETVAVNRVADELTLDLLGGPTEGYVLEDDCTAAFFDDRSPGHCRFSGATLNERVGLAPRHNVNVTVSGNVTEPPSGNRILCWDDGADELFEVGSGSCGSAVTLAAGPNPVDEAETVTAHRTVALDGTDVTLEVEMW